MTMIDTTGGVLGMGLDAVQQRMGCTQLVSAIIFRTVNFARMEHALLRMKCGALEAAAQKIGALAAELTNSKDKELELSAMNATLTDELAQLRERHQVALATPPNHSEGELGARVQQLEHQLQQAHAEVAQLGEELATQMQQSSAAELRAAESLKEAADGRASVMALQQQLQDTEQTWKKKLDDMTSTHVLRDSQGRQDLGQAHMLEAEHVAQVEVQRTQLQGARDTIDILRRANACERFRRIIEDIMAGVNPRRARLSRCMHGWMVNFLETQLVVRDRALQACSGRANMVADDILVLAQQAEESAALTGMLQATRQLLAVQRLFTVVVMRRPSACVRVWNNLAQNYYRLRGGAATSMYLATRQDDPYFRESGSRNFPNTVGTGLALESTLKAQAVNQQLLDRQAAAHIGELRQELGLARVRLVFMERLKERKWGSSVMARTRALFCWRENFKDAKVAAVHKARQDDIERQAEQRRALKAREDAAAAAVSQERANLITAGNHARRKFVMERIRNVLVGIRGREEHRFFLQFSLSYRRYLENTVVADLDGHVNRRVSGLKQAGADRLAKLTLSWLSTRIKDMLSLWQLRTKGAVFDASLEGMALGHRQATKASRNRFAETVLQKLKFRREQLLKASVLTNMSRNFGDTLLAGAQHTMHDRLQSNEIQQGRDRVARLRRVEIRVSTRRLAAVARRALSTWLHRVTENALAGVEGLYENQAQRSAMLESQLEEALAAADQDKSDILQKSHAAQEALRAEANEIQVNASRQRGLLGIRYCLQRIRLKLGAGLPFWFDQLRSNWTDDVRASLCREKSYRNSETMEKEVAWQREQVRAEAEAERLSEWEAERHSLFVHLSCEQIQRIVLLRMRAYSTGFGPDSNHVLRVWHKLLVSFQTARAERFSADSQGLTAELSGASERHITQSAMLAEAQQSTLNTTKHLGMQRIRYVWERAVPTWDRRCVGAWRRNMWSSEARELKQRLMESHRTGVRLQNEVDQEIMQRRAAMRDLAGILNVWPTPHHLVAVKLHAAVQRCIKQGPAHDAAVREITVAARSAGLLRAGHALNMWQNSSILACVKNWHEECQVSGYASVLDTMANRQGALRVAHVLVTWSHGRALRAVRRWHSEAVSSNLAQNDSSRLRRNLRKLNAAEGMGRVLHRWTNWRASRVLRRWFAGARMAYVHNLSGKGWQKYLEAVQQKHYAEINGYVEDMAQQDEYHVSRLYSLVCRPLLSLGGRIFNKWNSNASKTCVARWHEKAATERTYNLWAQRLFQKYAGRGAKLIDKDRMVELVAAISLYDGEMTPNEIETSLEQAGARPDGMGVEAFCQWIKETYAGLPLDVFDEGMNHLLGLKNLAVSSTTAKHRAERMKAFSGIRMSRVGQKWVEKQELRCVARWKERTLQARNDTLLKKTVAAHDELLKSTIASHEEATEHAANTHFFNMEQTVERLRQDAAEGRDQVQMQMRKLLTTKLSTGLTVKSGRILYYWIAKAIKICLSRWHEKAATERTYVTYAQRLFQKYAGYDHGGVLRKAQMVEFIAAISLYDRELSPQEVETSLFNAGGDESGMRFEHFSKWVQETYAGLPLDVFCEGMDSLLGHRDLAVSSTTAKHRAERMKAFSGIRMSRVGQKWVEKQELRCVARWKERTLQARNDTLLKKTVDALEKERGTERSTLQGGLDDVTKQLLETSTKLDHLQGSYKKLNDEYKSLLAEKIALEMEFTQAKETAMNEYSDLKVATDKAASEAKDAEQRLRSLLDAQSTKSEKLTTELEVVKEEAKKAAEEVAKLKYEKGKLERELKIAVDLAKAAADE